MSTYIEDSSIQKLNYLVSVRPEKLLFPFQYSSRLVMLAAYFYCFVVDK